MGSWSPVGCFYSSRLGFKFGGGKSGAIIDLVILKKELLMKRVKLFTLIFLALVLTGCTKNTPNQQTGQSNTEPEQASQETEVYEKKDLKSLISLGKALKCSYEVAGNSYEGYVKGNQWRGEFKNAEGKKGEVIITKEGCIYNWDPETKEGIKICMDPKEVWDDGSAQMGVQDNYICRPAVITDAKFEPPTDVKFIDPFSQIPNMGQ